MPHSTRVLEARTQPNIYHLVTVPQNKQRDTDKTVMRLLAGDAPTEKTKANREKAKRMDRIREQYADGKRSLLQHVDAMGLAIKLL